MGVKMCVNGKIVEMTEDAVTYYKKKQTVAQTIENLRSLSVNEVLRLFIAQNINTIITDDATASRAVEFHPGVQYDGSLIPSKTRINWGGTLKRAAVDLWDTEENNPDNAPDLWEDINYRNGYRIIPDTITATLAFAEDEYGWWGDTLYRSKVKGNVYTPSQYPDNWEFVMKLTTGEED